ncbi:guanylate kinase [Anaplasma phagocytophilum]|uniref:guanylate kinase n=1 Tax=Anaplasma phagocytophilum TaxID=948 RepID=UPI003D97C538
MLKSVGVILVLSSPSGCGKTTVANKLLEKQENNIVKSVSITTRAARKGEKEGKDYYFVDREEFLRLCSSGEIIEHAEVFGNFYGVPRKNLEDNVDKGVSTLLVIDWQGAFKFMEMMREHVVSIFIIPPSMEELRRRLCGRRADDSEVVEARLKGAAFEISHCESYDYVIVNEDIEETADRISNILRAEQMKTCRQVGLRELLESRFPLED